MGVVSKGSSVPCSRSPTTEYAASVEGMMTGMTRKNMREMLTVLSKAELAVDAEVRKMVRTGLIRKRLDRDYPPSVQREPDQQRT
jgi:hypothetical protein